MVIAGAGGHALEIFDILLSLKYSTDDILFYDDFSDIIELNNCNILKSKSALKEHFKIHRDFCLGVGSPYLRRKMHDLMVQSGGFHCSIVSPSSVVSPFCINEGADIMPCSFVSSQTSLGKGTLINVGAKIHHEVRVGEYNEISPSAVLLGQVKVGNNCSIGANVTILPKVILNDEVIVGAGAVVTKSIGSKRVVKGIPAR